MSKSEAKKTKNFRSLAVTLAVSFSVLIIVVLIIAGGFQVYFSFRAQQENLIHNLTLIAHEAANTVNNFIQEKFSILVATSRFGNLLTVSHEEQEATLDKLLGIEPAFRQLVLFDSQEEESLRVSRISKLLSAQLMRYDKNELFSKINKKETYISPSVYIDEITSEPIVVMAAPVIDVFGDLKGVLVAEANLKFMWDLVAEMKVGKNGLAYVVDKDGNLIAFSDIGRVLRGENLGYLEEVAEFIGGSELTHKDDADIGKGIEDNYVVSNHAHLSLPNWAVMVELPATEAYATVIYGIELSVVTVVLVALVAIVVSNYLSKQITKPLISLTAAAREMRGGKLETKIEIKSRDEIGELTTAFNEMAARLRTYTGELESEVAERTRELDKKVKEISKSNIELKEVQSAMMNLLEDARELEEALEKEKESVERKVVERTHELQEEHARLMASINSLSFGFILADVNHRIVLKNIALSHILGMPEADLTIEAITKGFGEAVDLRAKFEQCIRERRIIELKDVKFGKEFLRLLLAPIVMLHDSNEVIGYVVLIEDVTEAKVLERSREEFFSIASHELRTPLTAIRGNASLIQEFYLDKIKDGDVVKMISDMHEASIRLIKIVSDFLDVSRLEQGRVEFEKKPFDIIVLIQEVINELEKMATTKNLYLRLEKTEITSVTVAADKDKTKQILFNLIGNAINYTREGGISIKLEKQDKFSKVYVSDTGVGILPENQTLLFRKFQQAGEKILTRDVTKGTGLGLYISKLLVEGMGGTIELVKSQPGKGSTFGLTLPTSL